MKRQFNAQAVVDQLAAIYDESVANLRQALARYVEDRTAPDARVRKKGAFAYPELRIEYGGKLPASAPSRAFARLNQPGTYATSIARPELFRDYLVDQLEHLARDYDVEVSVGRSASEIPYAYVIENSGIQVGDIGTAELSRYFPSNELVHLGDEIADGVWVSDPDQPRPLALFDGPRTDFSLARLRHYTGTPPEHFQQFVLFTNYVRYVDEFVGVAIDTLRRKDSRFTALSVPGALYEPGELTDAEAQIAAGQWRRHQMPAYHLMAEGRTGITLVNIGVGPSNAKTVCDHVAVLRPGGVADDRPLRRPEAEPDDRRLCPRPRLSARRPRARRRASARSPAPGDRRGAERFVRRDDDDHRRGRGQRQAAPAHRHGRHHRRPELGAALCRVSALRFNQSRAVAIDMESATVAAQGYRFRVPYGTLLCVSDKPLHGELKLPGQANAFYERAISQHLRIGIEALNLLQREGEGLHSRKLRSFDEPPLR